MKGDVLMLACAVEDLTPLALIEFMHFFLSSFLSSSDGPYGLRFSFFFPLWRALVMKRLRAAFQGLVTPPLCGEARQPS